MSPLEKISPLVKNCCYRGCLEGMGMWRTGVALAGLVRSCLWESGDFEMKPKECVDGRDVEEIQQVQSCWGRKSLYIKREKVRCVLVWLRQSEWGRLKRNEAWGSCTVSGTDAKGCMNVSVGGESHSWNRKHFCYQGLRLQSIFQHLLTCFRWYCPKFRCKNPVWLAWQERVPGERQGRVLAVWGFP